MMHLAHAMQFCCMRCWFVFIS